MGGWNGLKSARTLFGKPLPILMWLLTGAWLSVCLVLSSQTGVETTALSQRIAHFLARLLRRSDAAVRGLHGGLRTFAHFACFFVLCDLMSGALSATFPIRKCAYLWSLLPCVAFAFLDEMRKASIPGRHCSIPEACLNAVGCLLGCAAFRIVLGLLRRRDAERL